MPSVPGGHRDRLVLVGDAVHAPSNSSGQGASLAIESAIELVYCLRDLPDAPTAYRCVRTNPPAEGGRHRRPRGESQQREGARPARQSRDVIPRPVRSSARRSCPRARSWTASRSSSSTVGCHSTPGNLTVGFGLVHSDVDDAGD
jgi:hypothetical protein